MIPSARAAPAQSSGTAAPSPAVDAAQRPIDLVFLTRQTFGDRRLEAELLRLFARQARQVHDDLDREGTSAGSDLELIHALVGSARVVGASRVATLATSIEAKLRRAPDAVAERVAARDRATLRDALDEACRFVDGLIGPL